MGKIQTINSDSELQSLLNDSDKTVFIDFFAEWCGPCKMIEPIIEELSIEYESKITFVKINIDENVESASTYGIRSIPTFIVIKNNNIIFRNTGAMPKSFFIGKLNSLII